MPPKKNQRAVAAAAPLPTAPVDLAPEELRKWWKGQIDAAAARHASQMMELDARVRSEKHALSAAHKVEADALHGAQVAAMAATCGENMIPCTMCKTPVPDDDDGVSNDVIKCVACELPYCYSCAYGGGNFPNQCVDCAEDDQFNCCKGETVTSCYGRSDDAMVCEDCVPKHKSGGNRGKRKGMMPDGCTCLLTDDDY